MHLYLPNVEFDLYDLNSVRFCYRYLSQNNRWAWNSAVDDGK